MERRIALKTLAGTLGGLIALPAWATNWTPDQMVCSATSRLSTDQLDLLANIVETIIPATNTPGTSTPGESTPGAKALNVHQFVQKMVMDCSDKPAQDTFTNGLGLVEDLAQKSFGKAFRDGDTAQRMALLTQMSKSADDPAQKDFYQMVKNLTIRGFMNSEYVMTNLTHYQFIPGHYYGCVPVVAKAATVPNSGR